VIRISIRWAIIAALTLVNGCGTTTKRLATEQLLISDAVDEAVHNIDFSSLAGRDVFLDTTYMRNVKGIDFANTDYIISSLRQQMAAGCRLQEDREKAQIVVESRVGALGTDGHEVNYGLPQTSQFALAATALSSAPVVPALPEISFARSNQHLGIAKIVLFAYDRESRLAVWQSGVSRSESSSQSSWVLGAGPFQKGSIHDGTRFAGRKLRAGLPQARYDEPYIITELGAESEGFSEQLPEKLADATADATADVANDATADATADASDDVANEKEAPKH